MRKRTRSRVIALKTLYQIDLRGPAGEALADEVLDEESGGPDVKAYARELVAGVMAHREEIDRELRQVAENWTLERMPVIDRNVLRIGVYEMTRREDIPPKVAINEAVELAKKYSTEESGAFVNGILDRIREGAGRHGESAGP